MKVSKFEQKWSEVEALYKKDDGYANTLLETERKRRQNREKIILKLGEIENLTRSGGK